MCFYFYAALHWIAYHAAYCYIERKRLCLSVGSRNHHAIRWGLDPPLEEALFLGGGQILKRGRPAGRHGS